MKNYNVISNQSLLDISISELGSIEAVFDLALVNNLELTEDLNSATQLIVPDSAFLKAKEVQYFLNKKISTLGTKEIFIPQYFQKSFTTTLSDINYRVISNQTLLDVAVENFGSIESVFDLALFNDLEITSKIDAGDILNIPASSYFNVDVSNYFKNYFKRIATDVYQTEETIISYDFYIPGEIPFSL